MSLSAEFFDLRLGQGAKLNPPGEPVFQSKAPFLQTEGNTMPDKEELGEFQVYAKLIGESEDVVRHTEFECGISIKTLSFELNADFEKSTSQMMSSNSLGVIIKAKQNRVSQEIKDPTKIILEPALDELNRLQKASGKEKERLFEKFLEGYGDAVVTKVTRGWNAAIYLTFTFKDRTKRDSILATMTGRYFDGSTEVNAHAKFLQYLRTANQSGMLDIQFGGKGLDPINAEPAIRKLLEATTGGQPGELLSTITSLFKKENVALLPDTEYSYVPMSNYTHITTGTNFLANDLSYLRQRYIKEVARRKRIEEQRNYAVSKDEKDKLYKAEKESMKLLGEIEDNFRTCRDHGQGCKYVPPDPKEKEIELGSKIEGDYIFNGQKGMYALAELWKSCQITDPVNVCIGERGGEELLRRSPLIFRLTNANLIKQINIFAQVGEASYRGTRDIFPTRQTIVGNVYNLSSGLLLDSVSYARDRRQEVEQKDIDIRSKYIVSVVCHDTSVATFDLFKATCANNPQMYFHPQS